MASKITGERVPTLNPDPARSDRAVSDGGSAIAEEGAAGSAVTVDPPESLAVHQSGPSQRSSHASADRWAGVSAGDSGHRTDVGSEARGVSQAVRELSENVGAGLLALYAAATPAAR